MDIRFGRLIFYTTTYGPAIIVTIEKKKFQVYLYYFEYLNTY